MGEDQYTVKVTRHTSGGGTDERVLDPNPLRVTLVVALPTSVGSAQIVALGWPGGTGLYSVGTGVTEVIKYSDVGPLVSGAWGVSDLMMGTVVVFIEILLLQR